jgi:GntR family transcriptional regulator
LLPIQIDKRSGIPIYVQLGEQIRLLIREGILQADNPVPTVRGLAVDLGINANTVARVYRELEDDGLLRLERGVGTFVASTTGPPVHKLDFQEIDRLIREVIRLGKKAGMSAAELAQFIQTRWQEVSDASR